MIATSTPIPLVSLSKSSFNQKAMYDNEVLMIFLLFMSVLVMAGMFFAYLVNPGISKNMPTTKENTSPPRITVNV